jgi:putative flippase GtrA
MGLAGRLIWFAIAGGLGFVVDAGLLTLVVRLGLDPWSGRLVSFAAALTATWLVNRSRTFGDRAGRPSLREFGQYAAASMVAAAINLAVYMLLVTWGGPFRAWPVLAVAVATAVSMSVNFWSYMTIVFAPKR